MITVWLLIGTLVFIGWQWYARHEKAKGYSVVTGAGKTVITVNRSRFGHYYLRGTINGSEYDLLVDTGATLTTIPKSLAKRTHVVVTDTQLFNTANGKVNADIGKVTIELHGMKIEQHPVAIIDTAEEQPLLGMDILKRMKMTQGDGVMTFQF